MSKFINTNYKKTIDSLVNGFKNNMKNPYYLYTESKPTLVTYYNINTHKTSLDPSLETTYDVLGSNSTIKFNKIKDFYIYGIDKVNIDLDDSDFGMESSSIEGEAIILPNTIIPIPNDYFTINYEDKKILFKVLSVNIDTIENGVNFYKINYKIDQPDNIKILDQIVDNYTMIIDNIGTNFKTIIKQDEYYYITKLDEINVKLKSYYKSLFYSERVQTFIIKYNDTNFYDSYLIEFLLRNKILDSLDDYLYIDHQLKLKNTFPLDYDKTIFRFFELHDLNDKKPLIYSQGIYINDPLSIFSSRMEEYYNLEYIKDLIHPSNYIINNFDSDILDRIYNNTKYKENIYKNIFIKYFNNEEVSTNNIYSLEKIEFKYSINLFYEIPFIIYIINVLLKKLLTK